MTTSRSLGQLLVLALSLLTTSVLAPRDARADVCRDGLCTAFPEGYVRGRYDAVPGAPSSDARPRGTLFLAYAHRTGGRLVEWDIAASRPVRSASLGGQAGAEADLAIATTSTGVVAVVAERSPKGEVKLVVFDDALRPTVSRRLGTGRSPAMVRRGDEVFVTWLSAEDRLSIVRVDAVTGDVRARVALALPERAAMFPGVSIVHSGASVIVVARAGTSLALATAPLALDVVTTSRLDAEDGTLLLDGDTPHLVFRERGGAIVDALVADDLTLGARRTVDEDRSPIAITGAFSAEHVLALPSGLLVPAAGATSAAIRRATSHQLVERILWIAGRVITLETSSKAPTLAITRDE